MNSALVFSCAELLSQYFSSDQNFHILQQQDGTYRKTFGQLSPQLIAESINQSRAFGSYQKFSNGTVRWLCFDFDVRSTVKESEREIANRKLNTCVIGFCELLKNLSIPFAREHSGNRGQHIWIFFEESISYTRAYEIASAICTRAAPIFDSTIIALDRFPPNRMPSDGPGLGVKLPLSLHKKSKAYSYLLDPNDRNSEHSKVELLTDDDIAKQLQLLQEIRKISKYKISDILGVPIWDEVSEVESPHRVRRICLANARFSVEELISHWRKTKSLAPLGEAINSAQQLNNFQRKLIVGLLININSAPNFSNEILHKIFSVFPNYDQAKTEAAIQSLSGFFFPSQDQIEATTEIPFKQKKTLDELLRLSIPHYRSHEDASFEISAADCDVVKAAEIKYIFENDEAVAYSVVNKLLLKDGEQFASELRDEYHLRSDSVYEHVRQETLEKSRRLVSLGANERVVTSAILKQIDIFFNFRPSVNSFGYQIQKNFSGARIFQPWLTRWSNFISDINNVIDDETKLDYIVIKTDILSFYDTIPHEYIKRMMLGGGGNICINDRYSMLSEELRTQYQNLIEKLFKINSITVSGLYGLPQGPAYARYLAELYLDELDRTFDVLIAEGDVTFYHRYVDDIFILCKDMSSADETIKLVRDKLVALGLKLNESKTVKTDVGSFYTKFDKYRRQAKYVADRASRDLEEASPKKRSEAITAFMQVLKGDSASDDLAFIFSHLQTVHELDSEKLAMVDPVLKNRLGRGRMMKHLFQFVLEDESRWENLVNITEFSALQAEVLSGNLFERAASRFCSQAFLELIPRLVELMPSTVLVKENMCFIHLITGVNIGKHFDREVAMRCAVLMPASVEYPLPDSSVDQMIIVLSAERSLPKFCHALYLLSFGEGVSSARLNQLAQVFFAKIGQDEEAGVLDRIGNGGMYSVGVAMKFYQLLCLFSMATHGSIDLVKACWRLCSDIFDRVSMIRHDAVPSGWFAKLPLMELDNKKINFILTSILEGNINAGSRDVRKAFDRFHNAVIFYIASDKSANLDADSASIMEELRKKATFYDWLIERVAVSSFPAGGYFERNAFDNDCIMLRREDQVLVRRPIDELKDPAAGGHHAGYAEIVIPYNPKFLVSIDNILSTLDFAGKLSHLVGILKNPFEANSYPNLFPKEAVIKTGSLNPFTDQLNNLPNILYEDANGQINVFRNNALSFISCYFRGRDDSAQSGIFYLLGRKYISKMQDFDLIEFLTQLTLITTPFPRIDDAELLDRCVAAALWKCLEPSTSTRRIGKFLEYYLSFTRDQAELHIFCVDDILVIDGSNPVAMCETIKLSVQRNWTLAAPGLQAFMVSDLDDYLSSIESILTKDESQQNVTLVKFKKARVHIEGSERIALIENEEHQFENIYLINVVDRTVQLMNSTNYFFVQISNNVFVYHDDGGKIYMLGFDKSWGAIYETIERKFNILKKASLPRSYQPVPQQELDLTRYTNFTRAVEVVALHRDILTQDAISVTSQWLERLPEKFHEALINLLAGHVVMQKGELNDFTIEVDRLLRSNETVFFLKTVGDHNGTQRIIYRKPELGRLISGYGPGSIPFGTHTATLVVDNVLTGSQIINTLKYYATNEGFVDPAYFPVGEGDMGTKLRSLKVLKIRQIFHTLDAISRIQQSCREFMSPELKVVPVGGRDIGKQAFFAGTNLITTRHKESIAEVFASESAISELRGYIEVPRSFAPINSLDEMDLVARYLSLPKKCFTILHSPLRNGQGAPLTRIREAHEVLKS